MTSHGHDAISLEITTSNCNHRPGASLGDYPMQGDGPSRHSILAKRLAAGSDQTKSTAIWGFANSAFGIFLFGTVVVGFATHFFTTVQRCYDDAGDLISKWYETRAELRLRDDIYRSAIKEATNTSELKQSVDNINHIVDPHKSTLELKRELYRIKTRAELDPDVKKIFDEELKMATPADLVKKIQWGLRYTDQEFGEAQKALDSLTRKILDPGIQISPRCSYGNVLAQPISGEKIVSLSPLKEEATDTTDIPTVSSTVK